MSAGAPIAAAVTPLGIVSSNQNVSSMASVSVKISNPAPSTALDSSSCRGVLAPNARAIFGVSKPIKLMMPTAVIEAETNQIPMTISKVKAGTTGSPLAVAPSWPRRSNVRILGAMRNKTSAIPVFGSNHSNQFQLYWVRSPAPHMNTFWAN